MRSIFGRWICAFALVAAAVTTVSPGVAEAEEVEQSPTTTEAKPALTSLSPQRFADTRPGTSTIDGAFAGAGRRAASSVYKVQIAGRGSVPTGASGAIINIAAVNPGGPGFFTVYSCGTRPTASAVNYTTGVDIANEVLSVLSSDGSVCVFTLAPSDLLIDVVGYTTTSDSMKSLSPKRSERAARRSRPSTASSRVSAALRRARPPRSGSAGQWGSRRCRCSDRQRRRRRP